MREKVYLLRTKLCHMLKVIPPPPNATNRKNKKLNPGSTSKLSLSNKSCIWSINFLLLPFLFLQR